MSHQLHDGLRFLVILIIFKSDIHKKSILPWVSIFGNDCIFVRFSLQSFITFKIVAKLPRLCSNSNFNVALFMCSSLISKADVLTITNCVSLCCIVWMLSAKISKLNSFDANLLAMAAKLKSPDFHRDLY